MSGLLPSGWSGRHQKARATLIAAIARQPGASGSMLTIFLRRSHREAEVGRFDPDLPDAKERLRALARKRPGAETVLRVPAAMLLEREFSLPLAAERDLVRVLGYEMDRLTPFQAKDVIWSHEILARDRARNRVMLRLSLIPRAPVASMLAWLDGAGLTVSALQAGASEPPRLVRLQRGPTARERWDRRLAIAAAAACAVLGLAALAVPVVRQSLALAAAEDRIEALRPLTAQADTLRRRIAEVRASGDAIAEQRNRSGDALAALAALTDILPDDTFLTEMAMNQRHVALRGQSASAPRLIALLAADPSIRNPAFTAPVTRGEGGRDQFALQAEVAP
ncbi:MAG TPA: PilN domain-containing protein [Acetobacteraceae bacterium]